jgi:hypothetical protein
MSLLAELQKFKSLNLNLGLKRTEGFCMGGEQKTPTAVSRPHTRHLGAPSYAFVRPNATRNNCWHPKGGPGERQGMDDARSRYRSGTIGAGGLRASDSALDSVRVPNEVSAVRMGTSTAEEIGVIWNYLASQRRSIGFRFGPLSDDWYFGRHWSPFALNVRDRKGRLQ